MEPQAAKLIGAGIAVLPLLGVGIGLGMLFSSIITAMGPRLRLVTHGDLKPGDIDTAIKAFKDFFK